ncbi:MAG TPA: glycosyltransferase, partial [Clostridium perfringens]|nr:glycosyltransferase [Clostridium perfringens]
MKFSVLMSVYHKENPEFLKEALDSVINQTVQPTEIVIVKDGKLTKELDDAIDMYIKNNEGLFNILELETNCGLGVALSKGINVCKYDIIARMDSDDISDKYRFEKQLDVFKKNQKIDIVGSNIAEFMKDINII